MCEELGWYTVTSSEHKNTSEKSSRKPADRKKSKNCWRSLVLGGSKRLIRRREYGKIRPSDEAHMTNKKISLTWGFLVVVPVDTQFGTKGSPDRSRWDQTAGRVPPLWKRERDVPQSRNKSERDKKSTRELEETSTTKRTRHIIIQGKGTLIRETSV